YYILKLVKIDIISIKIWEGMFSMIKVLHKSVLKKTVVAATSLAIVTASLSYLPQRSYAAQNNNTTVTVNYTSYSGLAAPSYPISGPSISPDGKVTWTVKAVKEVLQRSAAKIDAAIDKAIDLIPFVSAEQKAVWKTTIKVTSLLKALDVIIDYSGTAEDIISKGIQYLGVPEWVADIIARTISTIFF
ncbi:hypothetical protein, partial [Paenibacillus chitinolyticus]|uniref:hypothetical protein n=1 Tax=Paenibacillus chitinolyticus TaxID=79263 RepID=UPI00366A61A0